VPRIAELVSAYVTDRRLLAKDLVTLYEDVQEFVVAERWVPRHERGDDSVALPDGAAGGVEVVGCGALHVMWSDLAEVRTVAVSTRLRGAGVGRAIVAELVDRARRLGVSRVFCLTFEKDFFASFGFVEIEATPIAPEVYAEMLRSHDEGVAEFLDLARVKANTLGNHRMLLQL
jgi:amino-acid N-acetyltransferase